MTLIKTHFKLSFFFNKNDDWGKVIYSIENLIKFQGLVIFDKKIDVSKSEELAAFHYYAETTSAYEANSILSFPNSADSLCKKEDVLLKKLEITSSFCSEELLKEKRSLKEKIH